MGYRNHHSTFGAADGTPLVVSSRFGELNGHTLDGYKDTGSYTGYAALNQILSMAPSQVLSTVRDATLLGRGGAGFPAGVKWGFLPPDVQPRYIVVNGDESEPGTYKDRLLMERDPHQLIEGCLIAAYAVGASQVFLYVRGEMAHAQERIAAALNEAYAAGLVGRNIAGTDYSVDIVMAWGAGAYIVGEETALIESLEGERGMPRLKPPYFPAAKGLYMAPTIVNNVETLSNLPWLFNHGVENYLKTGTEASPGTRLIALSGHVNRPGVYEIPQGTTTFEDLFYGEDYGQGIRDGNQLKMFIPGGGSAPWFYPEQVGMALEGRAIGGAGSMLGSGAIVVMDDTTDAVAAFAAGPLLRTRELRQVHAVPRGDHLAGTHPPPHHRGLRPPFRHRAARGRRRQHLAGPLPQCGMGGGGPGGHPVPPETDHHLPARPLGRCADHLGAAALPRRVRRLYRCCAERVARWRCPCLRTPRPRPSRAWRRSRFSWVVNAPH